MAFDLGTLLSQNQPTGNLQTFTPSSTNMADYNQGAVTALPKQSGGGIGSIPGELLHGAQAVGGALVNSAIGGVTGLYGQITGNDLQPKINNLDTLTKQQNDLATSYKTGKISKTDYQAGLKDLQGKFTDLSGQFHNYNKDYRTNFAKNEGQVALTLATLLAPEARAASLGGEGLLAAGANKAVGAAGDLLGAGKSVTAANKLTQVGGSLTRNALAVQPTVQIAAQSATDLSHGDIVGAAGNAALLGAPAIAGKVAPLIKAAASSLGTKLFGKSAILNEVFNPADVARLAQDPKSLQSMKEIEQYTLNQPSVHGDLAKAAPQITNHLMQEMHINPQDPNALQQLVANWQQYHPKLQLVDNLINQGKLPATAVVSHNFAGNIPQVLEGLKNIPAGDSYMGHLDQVKQLVNDLGIDNTTLKNKMINAIVQSSSISEARTNLEALIKQQTLKDLGGGYIATYGPKVRAALPGDVSANELVPGSAPSKLGQKIIATGLSPRAVSPQTIAKTLESNLQVRLTDAGIKTPAKSIISALKSKASNLKGASDIRMLTNKQVEAALIGVDTGANPRIVAKAVRGAYRDLPASMVGVGGKITNAAMNSVVSQYLKIQGMGKFELNPFFQYAKLPLKGGLVAVAEGASPASIFRPAKLSEGYTAAKEEGWLLSNTSTGGSGNVADELGSSGLAGSGATAGSKLLNAPLQSQIMGLADTVAKANGTTVAQIIADRGPLFHQLDESIGLIKGYGSGGYLNSPLAKTLNLAIFPSRFTTKVIKETGKIMAKMNPAEQVAMVASVANFSSWLGSPAGQKWQKDNAELVSTINALTPLGEIENVMKFLNNGHHVSDLGQIGGLPFGVITTVLEHQGIHLGPLDSSQGINPATGQPYANKIPLTPDARLKQGVTDIIGSMFSYPGATVGLPSKTKLIQDHLTLGTKLLTEAPGTYQYQLANGQPAPSLTTKQAPTTQPLPPIKPLRPTTQSPRLSAATPATKRSKIVPASMRLP